MELEILPFKKFSLQENKRRRIVYTVGIQETILIDALPTGCYMAAAVGDEWHTYGRAKPHTSARCDRICNVMNNTMFVLQMSGTFFPLGPKSDAERLMINVGGDWTRPNDGVVKWTVEETAKLKVIFKRQGNRLVDWSVIRLRRFLGTFLIRRSTTSKYRGQPVIPEKIARPSALPAAMPTGACPVEDAAQRWWRQELLQTSTANPNRMIMQTQLKYNARHAREIAWSELAIPFIQKGRSARRAAMAELRVAWPNQQ
jgi:hypothetical protein